MKPLTEDELLARFRYYPLKDQHQRDRLDLVRKRCLELAREVVRQSVPSVEQSQALAHLEEAMFWCSAAIARHYQPAGEEQQP